MNINIYSKYRVTRHVRSTYKSYDSDADDFWKEDKFVEELELDGGKVIELVAQKLNESYFQDVFIDLLEIGTMKVKITIFDPSSGEGDEFTYIIREMKEGDKNGVSDI